MVYYEFNVGDKEYKLRLSARSIVELEKKLGGNPLTIFLKNGEAKLPTLEDMIYVLHMSLQKFQHGISLDDVDDIVDEYLEAKTLTDLMGEIMEVYKVSGIISEDEEDKEAEGSEEKN